MSSLSTGYLSKPAKYILTLEQKGKLAKKDNSSSKRTYLLLNLTYTLPAPLSPSPIFRNVPADIVCCISLWEVNSQILKLKPKKVCFYHKNNSLNEMQNSLTRSHRESQNVRGWKGPLWFI